MKKNFVNYCILPTSIADFRIYDTGDEGVRLITLGDVESVGEQPLLRIHSSCLASEVFGARDCDCADQLRESMKSIAIEGKGMIIHLQQEGRGHGLSKKIQAVGIMQTKGVDTVESFNLMGLEQDIRGYLPVVKILNALGVSHVRLISNNPAKISFLNKHNIQVDRIGTNPNIRVENKEYLETKNAKLNHKLPLESLLSPTGDIRFNHSDQPWGEFSNFAPYSIYSNGKIWPTNEHFYQAQKFKKSVHQETIRTCPSPMRAKTTSQTLNPFIIADWESRKESVMLDGLRAKFTQHPDLGALLCSTVECRLIEHSLQDSYWGDPGDGSGGNRLGVLLMQVREELLSSKGAQ